MNLAHIMPIYYNANPPEIKNGTAEAQRVGQGYRPVFKNGEMNGHIECPRQVLCVPLSNTSSCPLLDRIRPVDT